MTRRTPNILGLLAAVTFFLCVILAHQYFAGYRDIPALAFSTASWLRADTESRGFMVDDLLQNQSLIGLSYDAIIDLLGQPDRAYDGMDATAKTYLTYDLGWRHVNPKALFKTESVSSLRITVDSTSTVTQTVILRDGI
ncbi:MAG: hypothetical protein ACF8OB_12210 [Phycisphaeraceae bacterium JB051]